MKGIRQIPKDAFPSLLCEISDVPRTLFAEGHITSDKKKFHLAVIGSTTCTPYGRRVCEYIIRGLKGYEVVIVSGLSGGINATALMAAKKNGLDILGIAAGGLRSLKDEESYAKLVLQNDGGLLSEEHPNNPALAWSFPRRNRLIAGASHAVLVIEAAVPSGSLVTARLALEYNRDVFAVPGSIFAPHSAGTNKLIARGAAAVTDIEELLFDLSLFAKANFL